MVIGFGREEVIFTRILRCVPAFGRTHSRYSLVLRFKSLERLSKPNIPKAHTQQYSAGSIRVVSCAKDVLPQYQLTEWLQI